MLNLQVSDLDAMVAQLRAAKVEVEVEVDPEECPSGVLGSLEDPDGNPIQLRQRRGVDG